MGAVDLAAQAANLDAVAAAAERAGMWALIVGDNHALNAGYANCFQPIPTMARLSARTGSLQVGAVLLSPFYHPLLLAEQIATLAAFVDAPTLWVFGVGDRQGAFDAFGLDRRRRASLTDATISAVRAFLAGETVNAAAGDWRLVNATIAPLPRHPAALLVAGAAPGVLERAGRLGDGWLTAQNATDDELVAQLAAYRSSCERHGRVALPVLRRDIHVAATDGEALAHVEPILAEGYRGATLDKLLVGSPATIIERLAAYDRMGFHHVLVRHITGDHEAMLASFELIGRDVVAEVAAF